MFLVFASLSVSNSIASTGLQRIQNLAQNPDPLQVFLRNQQLFLTRTRALNIDRREDALVDQLAVEDHFRCCPCP